MQDSCGFVPVTEAGQARLCPLQAALATRPDVESYDDFGRVALSLFRFIAAAYATGASDCWEAAYRFADEAPGITDSQPHMDPSAGGTQSCLPEWKCRFRYRMAEGQTVQECRHGATAIS